jgi:hypothetical protein
MTKQFSLNFGFDVVFMGLDEDRVVEIEIKILNVDEKKFLIGSSESLDVSPLNLFSDWEGDTDQHGFMDFIDKEITKMGDKIEYSFNNSEEGEQNFFLSLFLIPRYDRLLIKSEDGGVEEYTFRFEDYVDDNNIHRRKWEIGRV